MMPTRIPGKQTDHINQKELQGNRDRRNRNEISPESNSIRYSKQNKTIQKKQTRRNESKQKLRAHPPSASNTSFSGERGREIYLLVCFFFFP